MNYVYHGYYRRVEPEMLCVSHALHLFSQSNSEGSWKTDIMKDKVGHSVVVTNLVCSLDINLDGRALGYVREV